MDKKRMAGKQKDWLLMWRQLGLTGLCAALVMLVLYGIKGLFPLGDGSIVMTDLYSQYVPLLYRFYDVVSGEKNLFLEFGISGGANLYVDTINELINPFNYVLFLFGRDRIYQAVNVVLLLYGTAAAMAANFFLWKLFPGKPGWNTALSLCYGLSGYLAYDFQIIKWMYLPVLFPFFLLALMRLLREKKGGVYAVLLAYQMMLSIQLGFMTLLFTLFVGGIWFFVMEPKKDRGAGMFGLGVYTLLGLCLSAAVWLPNVRILLASSRAGENLSYFGVMKRHGLDDLFERLFVAGNPVLVGMLAGVLWRYRPKNGRFLFLINVFLWGTVLLQPANLLWHMGSYVCFPVRYGYMVLLAMVWLVKQLLAEAEDSREAEPAQKAKDARQAQGAGKAKDADTVQDAGKRHTGILCMVTALLLCFLAVCLVLLWEDRLVQAFGSLAISSTCLKETLVAAGVCILFGTAAFLAVTGSAAEGRRVLAGGIAAVCGLSLCVMIFLPGDSALRKENEAAYRKMVSQSGEAGDDIFRREKEEAGLPLNAALVTGKNSLSGYIPTADKAYRQTLEKLGYLVPWVATQSVGGTVVSDTLLSECLILDRLPEQLTLEGDSVLERQEALTRAAAGRSLLLRFAGSQLMTEESSGMRLLVEGRQRLYLDLGMTANGYSLLVNGRPLKIPEENAATGPNRLIDLGSFENEEVEILVTDKAGTEISAETMELGALDEALWQTFWQEAGRQEEPEQTERTGCLQPEQMEADIKAGSLHFVIPEGAAGQTLFVPLAALSGWQCEQNQRPVDIVQVFGSFMGITLEEGENIINLSFAPPGIKTGFVLTLLGMAGLVLAGRVCRKRPLWADRAAALLYQAVFFAGIVGLYVLPAVGLAVYLIFKILR